MSHRRMLDGNGAVSEALRLARVQVISAYPITPQSPVVEKVAELVADGMLNAAYMRVESEHSAIACAIGAQLTGARAATATASVGLALMHEVLGVASGCRVPIVMPVINRALVSPWSLWCDHQDAMSERDAGWLQFYVENAQDTLDTLLIAYRVAEHEEVLTPAMVCLDGFFVSHCVQPVTVPDEETVEAFLPAYQPANLFLDPGDPMFINNLIPPSEFSEMRYQQKVGFDNALKIIPDVQQAFFETFGRRYDMVEAYRCEDADAVLVTLGSMAGTAKHVVNKLRAKNQRVGAVKLGVFRPFPVESLQKALAGKRVVGVLDRSAGLGAQGGPVWLEVNAAVSDTGTRVLSYVAGLGGRDITESTMETVFHQLLQIHRGEKPGPAKPWVDTRRDAMFLRPYQETAYEQT
jgi:pyruvate ferredoxin oxidoreductase alpha subunit